MIFVKPLAKTLGDVEATLRSKVQAARVGQARGDDFKRRAGLQWNADGDDSCGEAGDCQTRT
jgi:hypothetical protein